MDEQEFRETLDLFPIVRSRNYRVDAEKGSSSRSSKSEAEEWENAWDEEDKKGDSGNTGNEEAFLLKLRMAAERKVGPSKAEKFCGAFQRVHKEVINKRLSLDAARRYLSAGDNR